MAQNSQPADPPPSAQADPAPTPAAGRSGSGWVLALGFVFFLWQCESEPPGLSNLENRLTVTNERVAAERERVRVLEARVAALEQRLDSLMAAGARDPARR